MKQNIETFIGCDCEYEKAEIVLFGAPFDSTTSYRPGARFGSSAMRHESFGLETYSPYQDKDLTDCFVAEIWSCALAIQRMHFPTSNSMPIRLWKREKCHCFWAENIL